ncbi:MAG: DUF5011 domain-containing protein, partial [Candidatus Marinimicrobia bacterium]|nr:DUF5011 domain-containing protein [Candidatus Neomarinimicrobiota bacterium]
EVTIVVATNQPPVADAGADQSFDCVIGSTDVTLDGSASSDPDGDALSYSWMLDGTEVSSAAAFTDSIGGGVHDYILTVNDGQASASDTVSVTVNVDDEAPVITLSGANPDSVVCLYGYADPGASVADNCDANPAMTVASTVDTSQVGEYTITYSAVDASGNTAEVVRTVRVINHAPVVDNPVGEVVLSYGTSVLSTTIDLNSVFSDPDAHSLQFSDAIADSSVAGISLAGDTLTVTLGSLGSTTVTVTADDGCGGTVEDVFTVTINVTTDLADAVLFSLSGTDLKRNVDVTSGNVIVNEASASSGHHSNNDDDDDDGDCDNDDDDDDDNDHGRNGRHGGRDGGRHGGNDHGRGGHHDDDDDDDDDDHHHGPAYELTIGKDVTTAGGYSIRANAIRIGRQSQIGGDAYYNVLSSRGNIAGSEFSPLSVPQFVNLPPVAAAAPGTEDVTVRRNQSETLAAGDYDKIEIKQNATLVLTGGVYNVRELRIKQRGSLQVEAGTEIRIQRRLKVDERAYLGPADDASITAADILITVSGEDGHGHGHHGDDNDVKFEYNSTVYANVFAMDSKLSMKNGVEAVGAFWAREIQVHNNVTVTLDSYYSPAAGSMAKMTRSGDQEDADIAVVIPDAYTLHQNYPNPFNPTTTIGYALPEAGTVSLKIYDIRGNLVESLVQGYQTAGMHQVQFGSSQLSSGTYLYVLEAGGTRQVKRMAFIK